MLIKGAFFFAMPKIDYTKPWLDVPDQVAKLKARGLIVADMAEAERFLRYINYYRFSGFCLPFQYPDTTTNDRKFVPGTNFEDVVYLCRFDARMRDCISDALELVEISLRTSIAFHFGKAFGAFGHIDKANFDRQFSRLATGQAMAAGGNTLHGEWHDTLLAETKRSKEIFVQHFKQNYNQYPDLPIWVVAELCSFGTLSKMYSYMRNAEQGAVAKDYSLQYVILGSWLHTFTFVRNVCAHHARLWDKRLAISPMIPANKNWRAIAQCRQKVFIIALMLNWMLAHDSISRQDHTDWKKRLEALVDDFAARFPQLLHYTGFPTTWKKNPLWWQV